MMRVAVTGGHGFIGSAVCSALKEQNHEPVPVDRVNGYDIREPVSVREAFERCDAVIHLAGVLGTSELFTNPRVAVETNVMGTLNVLRACETNGMRYVGITMPEVFPSIYTATKRGARALEETYHRSCGVAVSRVRAFNVYGAGQAFGPGHPQKIVPTFAVYAWRNKPIPVWGDGSQLVDLIHVDDVAAIMVRALNFGMDQTFDAGSTKGRTVNEVANQVLATTGSEAGIAYLPMRKGEVANHHLHAVGVGWGELGWSPDYCADRLVEVVRSYKDHPCVYQS